MSELLFFVLGLIIGGLGIAVLMLKKENEKLTKNKYDNEVKNNG
jgi:hypothetical protein